MHSDWSNLVTHTACIKFLDLRACWVLSGYSCQFEFFPVSVELLDIIILVHALGVKRNRKLQGIVFLQLPATQDLKSKYVHCRRLNTQPSGKLLNNFTEKRQVLLYSFGSC